MAYVIYSLSAPYRAASRHTWAPLLRHTSMILSMRSWKSQVRLVTRKQANGYGHSFRRIEQDQCNMPRPPSGHALSPHQPRCKLPRYVCRAFSLYGSPGTQFHPCQPLKRFFTAKNGHAHLLAMRILSKCGLRGGRASRASSTAHARQNGARGATGGKRDYRRPSQTRASAYLGR
jgi:hypothetical protein